MANNLFSIDFSANKPLIQAKRAMFEAFSYMFWGKWMKWTTPDKAPITPNGAMKAGTVDNSPIVAQREFMNQSNPVNEMWIPTFRDLVGLGQTARESLTGMEEERKINFAKVRIEQIRHGEVVKQGKFEAHLLAKYGIPESSRMALTRQFQRRTNFLEIPTAIYKGISYNVLSGGRYVNDATVKTVSHPNFYVVGSGRVSQAAAAYPGTAAYETNVAAAVAGLTPAHVLSAAFLAALNADDNIRRIPYLYTKEGKPFRVLVVHPYGMASLRNDPDLKSLFNNVFVANLAKENPMLTGAELYYEGWAVFDGGNAIWPLSSDGSAITYGPTVTNLDSFNSYAGETAFGALVLGDNALFHGLAWDMEWTGEKRDHGQIESIGYTIGNGFARNDSYNLDDGAAGQYLINHGSAVVAHYGAVPTL
jgi:hypothetical protein